MPLSNMSLSNQQNANLRVFVAEDEAIIRLDLVEMLNDEGFEVVGETGRADNILDQVRDLRPDLLLLDLKMPGGDPLEVAGQIEAERLCAIVITSAFSDREIVERASAAGVHGYVVKPFGKTELMPAISVAQARFSQILSTEAQLSETSDRLKERQTVEKAKGILMQRLGLTEDDAFGEIRRRAMDGREKMLDVSTRIIAEDSQQ